MTWEPTTTLTKYDIYLLISLVTELTHCKQSKEFLRRSDLLLSRVLLGAGGGRLLGGQAQVALGLRGRCGGCRSLLDDERLPDRVDDAPVVRVCLQSGM